MLGASTVMRAGYNPERTVGVQPERRDSAFKGFGPQPKRAKQRAKRPPVRQSQPAVKEGIRPASRGGPPNAFRRLETAEDASRRIHTKAALLQELDTPTTDASAVDQPFGPRGLLLVGFEQQDAEAVQDWFDTMEPGFRVSCCNDGILGTPLQDALTQPDGSFREEPDWCSPGELVPHVALFSGMSKEEYLGLVEYWETTGIKQPIFAYFTPAAKSKPLRKVLLDIATAHAKSFAPQEEGQGMSSESLRALLKERLAAKKRGEKPDESQPIVLG